MIKRVTIVMIVIIIYVLGCFYSYKKDKTEDYGQYYLKTVIYKTADNLLVPVSMNFHNEIDLEQEMLNRIEMMKSKDFEVRGLYPLFKETTVINHIDYIDNILSIDFKCLEFNSENELDFIEVLSYLISDYQDIKNLEISLNGEQLLDDYQVASIINNNIGLNNFEYTNELLHHTYPVMIYHSRTINNYDYYIPITTRISDNISLLEQVNTILEYIEPKLICKDANLENQELNLILESNILIEDGKIEKDLFEKISFTFSSLKDINSIHIMINNEDIIQEEVSSYQINYIKI